MKLNNSNNSEERAAVGVWRCQDCGKLHASKWGKFYRHLTREEFYDFVNETWNCFCVKVFDLSLAT